MDSTSKTFIYKRMKHLFRFLALILLVQTFSMPKASASSKKDPIVVITTEFGVIKIKLYNETPLHRDNFIKLAKEGFYDGTLFHRVIKEFMIQGGDPQSKGAEAGAMLGNGGPGYTIPAEFNSSYFHKKGALAAAREGDQVNPEKKSSGSQFYIVQGKIFKPEELKMLEDRMNQQNKFTFLREYLAKPENAAVKKQVEEFQKAQNTDGINKIIAEIEGKEKDALAKVMKPLFSEEQKTLYSTVGGSPHLDGAYTVFGEVIEGLDVIDKIAASETDKNNRPTKDVAMKVTIID